MSRSERLRGPRVLVTDAQERWAVTLCRSLSRAGFRVTAAADFQPAVAHWSRFCSARVTVPDPHAEPARFADRVGAVVGAGGYATAIIAGDASLLAISRHRDLVEPHLGLGLGLPAPEAVEAASDKIVLLEAAATAKLDCPETVVCTTEAEARAAATRLGYPVILKPRRSVFEVGGVVRRRGSLSVEDPDELAAAVPGFGVPWLAQRAEDGAVFSCSGVFAGGRTLALCLARYVRTWPPAAGNAAFSETVDVPPWLPRRIELLLGALGWQGIFELELLQRPDGEFAAIDLNPRAYGSIALAVRAGADLPVVWLAWLSGQTPPMRLARPGVRYRWEDAELRRLALELRRGDLRAAASVVRPRRRVVPPHFAWNDPGPLLARGLLIGSRFARRVTVSPAPNAP